MPSAICKSYMFPPQGFLVLFGLQFYLLVFFVVVWLGFLWGFLESFKTRLRCLKISGFTRDMQKMEVETC